MFSKRRKKRIRAYRAPFVCVLSPNCSFVRQVFVFLPLIVTSHDSSALLSHVDCCITANWSCSAGGEGMRNKQEMPTLVLCDVNRFLLFCFLKKRIHLNSGIFVVEPLWALFTQPIPNASSSIHSLVTLIRTSICICEQDEAAAEL